MKQADLQSLIETSYSRIYRTALVLSGSRWDAEDLAQETMLAALASWRRFDARSEPDTWLYGILLNLHRKKRRSRQRAWRRLLGWFERQPQRTGVRPEQTVEQKQWRASLWAAVAQLPPSQQHVVVLRYAEDLSYEQIAQALGCPVGTVKSRLHHALKKLERELNSHGHIDNQTPVVLRTSEPSP